MNPGSHAPQACILDQARRQPHKDRCQTKKIQQNIINTLIKCRSAGLAESTLSSISHSLHQISKGTDLFKPEEVKAFISNMLNQKTKEPLSNASKQKHVNNYNYFVETNGLKWERPTYRIAETIPLIPKADNINKIISASTPKFATLFTDTSKRVLHALGEMIVCYTRTNRNYSRAPKRLIVKNT